MPGICCAARSLPGLPPVRLPMLLLRGVVGALAVADLLLRRRDVKA